MISVEVSTPNSVSVDDVVNRVEVDITTTGTSGGGGGGGNDHGGLTGLLDDDHPQYQRADSVFTTTDPYVVTDESLVVTTGAAITLPDAQSNAGRVLLIGSASQVLTVSTTGSDTIHGYGSSLVVNQSTGRQFVAVNTGSWGWAVTSGDHSLLDNLTSDDHLIYEPTTTTVEATGTLTATTETRVIMAAGGTVDLPDAATRPGGRTLTVLSSGGAVVINAIGTDNVFTPGQTTLHMPQGSVVRLAPVDLSIVLPGLWLWAVVDTSGTAVDLPSYYDTATGLPTASDNNVVVVQSGVPVWTTGNRTAEEFLSGTGWTDDVPVIIPVKNTSAGTIAKGAPVYATGTVGSTSVVEIAPADCDDAAKMPAIGLTNSSLAVNATGYVTVVGTVKGVNTNSYTVNQTLYVSTTAGQLTGTKPTGTSELIQGIGRVTCVNSSTGEILVLGAGRTNDIPNAIDAGKLTSGTVGTARLGTGTANSTTWLRGDQTWAEPTPWEVITDTTASVATATFSVTVTGYTDIEVMVTGIGDSASASLGMRVQFNSDTGSNYLSNNAAATTSWNGVGSLPGSLTNTDRNGIWRAAISLGGVGRYTAGVYQNGFITSTATTGLAQGSSSGSAYYINTSAAITTMSIFLSAGNFAAGTRLLVRGK